MYQELKVIPLLNEIYVDSESRMKKAVENTKHEFAIIRTGRASPALLDSIKIEYYGTHVPLKQIANIAAPEPRLLTVQPYEKQIIGSVEKAILGSDLGLNPSSDGNIIRIPIPSLTEERRINLVKFVHKLAEEGKVAIRNIRRDANEKIKGLEKNHQISEDESRRSQDKIQDYTDKYIDRIDILLKQKEKEIMEE